MKETSITSGVYRFDVLEVTSSTSHAVKKCFHRLGDLVGKFLVNTQLAAGQLDRADIGEIGEG